MEKKALVTGSALGIGKAIALNLASKGFDIAFHYRNSKEAADRACAEATNNYGVKAIALQADITNPNQAQSLVEKAAAELGGLSVVVNNVGNYLEKPLLEISVAEWHEILNSNLNATFYITQAAIPYLKTSGWGRIVNFGCVRAQHLIAHQQNAVYLIAKTGIILYTKSIAAELVEHNITANVISPGVAENSIGVEETTPLLPAKRPATLQEISNAVYFFISPEADYITGQVLEVAGGLLL